MEDPAGDGQGLTYDPEVDLASRYPDWTMARVLLGWGIREVLSPRWKVILVESSGSPAAIRCSLAHAVAHLDLGHRPLPAGPFELRQELAADRLAAARLVPLGRLLEVLPWACDAAELSAELGVEPAVLDLRLRGLTPAERRCLDRRVRSWAPAA